MNSATLGCLGVSFSVRFPKALEPQSPGVKAQTLKAREALETRTQPLTRGFQCPKFLNGKNREGADVMSVYPHYPALKL